MVGVQRFTGVVEQVSNPLEDRRGLPGAGHPLDHHQIGGGVSNDVVLFLLDRGDDVLHRLIVLPPQGRLQHGVADRFIGVKHVFNLAVMDGELALFNQGRPLGAGRGLVSYRAQGAVVIHPGNRGAPIVNQKVGPGLIH